MKKVRLDPEALDVQSFATVSVPGVRGTVQGAQVLFPPASQDRYCQSYAYCESGMCLGTLEDVCYSDRCTGSECVLEPWTQGQDTCQTCPSCATCPGMLGC